jgi:hypothetical protein
LEKAQTSVDDVAPRTGSSGQRKPEECKVFFQPPIIGTGPAY